MNLIGTTPHLDPATPAAGRWRCEAYFVGSSSSPAAAIRLVQVRLETTTARAAEGGSGRDGSCAASSRTTASGRQIWTLQGAARGDGAQLRRDAPAVPGKTSAQPARRHFQTGCGAACRRSCSARRRGVEGFLCELPIKRSGSSARTMSSAIS